MPTEPNSADVEDSIEAIIGVYGKYQIMVLILISIGRLPTEYHLTNVVFILPDVDFECMDQGVPNRPDYCPCQQPAYNTSVIASSVVTEWDLICDQLSWASLAQSILQVGILLGSLVYGYLSDKYGRKLPAISSLFCAALFGTLATVLPAFWMFLACRLLIGMAVGGTMLCCYILLIELSGRSFRPYLIALEGLAHCVGYFTLSIIAYFLRNWKHLMLATSAPWLLVISYYWLLPESPRWLITVGKRKEAVKLLTEIAKRNNRPTNQIRQKVYYSIPSMKPKNRQGGSFVDLFKTSKIRKYTIFSSIMWLCCAHTFFGINQYIGHLAGDLYLNVMLSALCLLPGLPFVVVASLYLKRRISIIISFSLPAITMLLIIFIPKSHPWLILCCAMIGQLGTYVAFILIYCYCAEVFPTYIRNSAMGFASVFARTGSFLAPFVVNIGVEWISMLIFSVLAICAGLVCLFLPETKNIVLLNTIEQVESGNESDQEPQAGGSK